MSPKDFYPLDIVREPKTGAIGIVAHASGNEEGGWPISASVEWLKP
jgi:hypothetical protein